MGQPHIFEMGPVELTALPQSFGLERPFRWVGADVPLHHAAGVRARAGARPWWCAHGMAQSGSSAGWWPSATQLKNGEIDQD